MTDNVNFYSVLTGIVTTIIGASIASLLAAITYIQWQDHELTAKNNSDLRAVIVRVDGVISRLDALVPNISERDAETQHAAMLVFIGENKERLDELEKRIGRIEHANSRP